MKYPIVEPNCPHNDPYCGDCHNKLPYKTKAEERLIKAALRVYRALNQGYTVSIDGGDTRPFLLAARAIMKERKKKK